MITVIGTSRRPIPTNSGIRRRYIRAEAAMIWPQARRRAGSSGAVGRQVARDKPSSTSAISAASTRRTGRGSCTSRRSTSEPPATAPQKKSVVLVPSTPPTGTA